MFPVLFSIGSFSVSSFGFFLAVAFLFATFLVWRLARAWDFEEEKILDLTLLTFFGGLVGARIFFISQNVDFFGIDIVKMIAITKYPGFSFWGAFLGGWLSLYFFSRKLKVGFWEVADIAAVGFLGGLIFGNIGCLLGGCGVGIESNTFLGVKMVGMIGNRLPIQGIEAILYMVVLWSLWSKAKHFHSPGRIIGLTLVYVGIIKFITEFFRAQQVGGHFFAITLILLGFVILQRSGKKSIKETISSIIKETAQIIRDRSKRSEGIYKLLSKRK